MEDKLAARREEYRQLLREALDKAVAVLSSLPEVERVSLVGSYARGRSDLGTDLDLVVVMRTELGFLERLRFLYPLLSLPVDLDLLCYTPEEFASLKEHGFLRHALKEEVVLYEKKPS